MPQTIMIAANDPNITYLLQRYAEESGFQTVSVCEGNDVLSLAHRTRPALIILDFELPGAAGKKMLHGLHAEAATCQIPVIVYSGLDEPPEDWDEGVAGYLPKSVMYDDFVAVLEHTGVHN
jgi:DNA-binding response OmpR family regulator